MALVAALVPAVASAGRGTGHRVAERAAKQPNVVLVLLDDMRADELRFLPRTRNLIAGHGRTYSQLIAAHPLCCPARATLTTGQYGQNNGVRNNKGPWGGYPALARPDNNIGRWLRAAGYDTAYYGKYLNGYKGSSGRPKGWNIWQPLVSGVYSYWDYKFYRGTPVHHRYITHTLRDKVRAGIGRFTADHKPFFMFVNQTAPHDAFGGSHFGPPKYEPKYAGLYDHLGSLARHSRAFGRPGGRSYPSDLRKWGWDPDREDTWQRARARALRSADDAIAGLVADLRAAHQLSNTYIIVTSDNGYQLGEHVWSGKNLLFRESLQVPMVIRGPGITPGSHNATQLTQADIAAQIVRWTGATPQRRLDGVPFSRAAARSTVLIQTGDSVADSTPGWWYRGVRTKRYTYGLRTTGRGGPGGILFDHRNDPDELHNRWNDERYAAVRRALHRRFLALRSCAGRACNNQLSSPTPSP